MEPKAKKLKKPPFSSAKQKTLETEVMVDTVQYELKEAAERNVLRYLIALIYDQSAKRMVLERGITFAPICPEEYSTEDPAAQSACIMVDFDNSDPSALNANFLAPTSG